MVGSVRWSLKASVEASGGHPDPKGYNTSIEFERRVRRIDEKCISHHIYEIWLEDIVYQGKTTTCIIGLIKPIGPYGAHLKEMLDDPNQNVTFSGRYFSDVSKGHGLTESYTYCNHLGFCIHARRTYGYEVYVT